MKVAVSHPQALSNVPPLRNYFLEEDNYKSIKRPPGDIMFLLVQRFGELMRKLWNPRNFKAHVSPHEMLQAVVLCSKKNFQITKQGEGRRGGRRGGAAAAGRALISPPALQGMGSISSPGSSTRCTRPWAAPRRRRKVRGGFWGGWHPPGGGSRPWVVLTTPFLSPQCPRSMPAAIVTDVFQGSMRIFTKKLPHPDLVSVPWGLGGLPTCPPALR